MRDRCCDPNIRAGGSGRTGDVCRFSSTNRERNSDYRGRTQGGSGVTSIEGNPNLQLEIARTFAVNEARTPRLRDECTSKRVPGPVTQETKALAGFPARASSTNRYYAQQALSGKQHAPPPQQSAAVEVACAVPSNASAAIRIKRYFIIPPVEFVSSRPRRASRRN